jgi:hypothetical protein
LAATDHSVSAVRLTIAMLTIVFTITIAVVFAEWPFIERAIALEDAPIAWLQSTLIVASAVTCLCRGIMSGRPAWNAIAAALLVLALDERFMGHERLKEWIWLEFFDADWSRAGRWPDVPMLFVAAVGAAVVTWITREIPAGYPAGLMWAALAAGAAALAMDVVWQTLEMQLWEELLELLAETLFFTSLLVPLNSTWPAGSRAAAGT